MEETLARFIDHTLLKPDATAAQIETLCREAAKYRFASVCVNPCRVRQAAQALAGTGVAVCCVVGFPLGASVAESKAAEARAAVQDGAGEIDMVLNIGFAKDGRWDLVQQDIAAVAAACVPARLKVILETCLLTREEIVRACQAAKAAGAAFVKTSTGFSSGGATAEDVRLMRQTVGPDMGVKAAGGIRTRQDAEAMLAAGADRLGASSGIAIVTG